MPTYVYACGSCKATIDVFQKITDGRKRKCPECGALKLKRQISSGGGIIFKGPGFHCTDYPKEKRND